MGNEIPSNMSDEFDNKLPQEFSPSEIELFSRRYCEPTAPIYKNNLELIKDPFKAIEAVDWHGPSLEKVTDPVDGLLVAKAKLDVAEKELRLNPKQKEHFSGVKENIEGAIGFLDTLRSKAESKAVRAIASGATIIGMTLGAAGCGNAIARPIVEPTSTPPVVEITPTPFEPSTPINPTLTVLPKPTEVQSVNEGAPYPTNAEYQLNGTELSIYNDITKNYELAKDRQGKPLEITAVKNINEEFLLVASNNSIFEWTKESGLTKQDIQGVWPEEIKIAGFNVVESLDKSGKPLGDMYQAIDEKGRTMLVKPAGGDKNWVVAPFGAALSNGVWRVWNVLDDGKWQEMSIVDAQGEMSKSSRLEPIAKIVIEELTNPEVEGVMYPFSEYTDFDLEVVPGREHEVYLKVLDAYAKSPVNRAYWNDVGFHGNTGEELYDWLKGSVGGPENQPYWLPGKSPNGTEFSSIMANGGRGVYVRPWVQMIENSGIYLRNIPYVIVSPFEYRNNVWARSLFSQLMRDNGKGLRPFLSISDNYGSPADVWGMLILDNRTFYVEGHTDISPAYSLLNLGGKNNEEQEIDLKIVTAWLTEYLSHLAKYPDKNTTQYFCISKTLNCAPRYVEVETLADVWFQFK